MLVRTPVSGSDNTEEFEAQESTRVVAALDPKKFDPTMQRSLHGRSRSRAPRSTTPSCATSSDVGVTGVVGVLLSVLVFFLQLRSVLALGHHSGHRAALELRADALHDRLPE